jgi:hypothetical protein
MGKIQRALCAVLLVAAIRTSAETIETGGYTLNLLTVTPKVETLTLRQYAQRFYQAPWWEEVYMEWPCILLKADGRIEGGKECDLLRVDIDAVEETTKEKRTVICYVEMGKKLVAVLAGESDITPLPLSETLDSAAWARTSWVVATARVAQATDVELPSGRARLLAPLAGLHSYSVIPYASGSSAATTNAAPSAPSPAKPDSARPKTGGEGGFLSLPDGTRYRGELVDNTPHGKGYMIWSDGKAYQGDFVNGIMQGTGIVYYVDGGIYQGAVMCNVRWGKGRMYFASGEIYQGEFAHDLMQGTGTYMYKDNSVYRGQFARGFCSGTGTLHQADKTVYQGDFLNGLPNGKGTYRLRSGAVYEGDVKDGAYQGKGRFTWPDKRVYEGDFVGGKRSGRGTMTWPDGTSFTGEFFNDVAQGRGVWREPGGTTYDADASEVGPNGKTLLNPETTKGVAQPAKTR